MVHFKPSRSRIRPEFDYWKLDAPKDSFAYRPIDYRWLPAQPDPARQHEREQRSLVNYHNCSDAELEAFCKSRKCFFPWGSPDRAERIATLEDQDDHDRFKRFMDLPPELREHVYEWHFLSLPTKDIGFPRQPPLTKASRLVRRESLPLFYKTCKFQIEQGQLSGRIFQLSPQSLISRIVRVTLTGHIGGNPIIFEVDEAGGVRRESKITIKGETWKLRLERAAQDRAEELEAILRARGPRLQLLRGDEVLIRRLFEEL